MDFWKTLEDELKNGYRAVLMYVIHSEGSSPGRQGFKMFVSASGLMLGSIGGGIMEHKWVNYCKKKLLQQDFSPFTKKQVHRRDDFKNASGLICSGEQTIAFYALSKKNIPLLERILLHVKAKSFGILELNENGLEFCPADKLTSKFQLEWSDDAQFTLKEDLGFAPQLYIAGGGHVSLALTKMAHLLGFDIHVLDNREHLNTVERNEWAKHYFIANYEEIHQEIKAGDNSYVVLMSFGYQTDKTILKSVLQKNFKYLGMMGSQEKVKKLFDELEEEGFTKAQLASVHAPVGLPIFSKTPEEIAVSILAEIIRVKNQSV